jgi:tetratricopeptide (TPR) repeat protein
VTAFENHNELDDLDARINATEYEEANRVLETMITTIEDNEHRYHPDLVRPLTLKGDALRGLGDAPGALAAYQRAIHVDRVNFGLYSPGQVSIVYKEADTYRNLGDLQEATRREEYAYEVLQKAFGYHGTELLPGVFHLADWYTKTYNVFSARSLYQHAVRIYEANGMGMSMEMIPALKGIASTYRLERFPPFYIGSSEEAKAYARSSVNSTIGGQQTSYVRVNNFSAGESALQRIIRIVSEQPVVDIQQMLDAVLDLADCTSQHQKIPRRHLPAIAAERPEPGRLSWVSR